MYYDFYYYYYAYDSSAQNKWEILRQIFREH